jgi:transposase-like protein
MARKKFNANFKAQVVLEMLENNKSIGELVTKYEIHPTQLKEWKKVAIAGFVNVFEKKSEPKEDKTEYIEALERKAGQLAVEIDFLKKNLKNYLKGNG